MADPTDSTRDHPTRARPASDRDETVSARRTRGPETAPADPSAAPSDAAALGPYQLVKELGKGGMGAVYLALDTRLNRKLALKVMLPELAADADAKERFLREARAAAQITHDNVVTVYEADERDGVPFIAMQWLQGYPLDDYLKKKGPPPLAHVVRIGRETALGLAAAHELGLVHRDIKPANLWLEAPGGRVKVLDFGLAKPVGTDTELTKSGAVVGTPAYMSPEQARGEKVDHRTDLFSLGGVLYRLCTGKTPFAGPNVMAVLLALGHDDPTPVRELNPAVPEPLAALIHQLLSKKPEQRPQTATEVAKRLRASLDQLLSPGAPAAAAPSGADAPTPSAAGLSASQPVVVNPVPHQPPVVVPMQITAQAENAFANLDAEDDATHAEPPEEPAPRPSRKAFGGKAVLIGAGLVVLLVGVAAAVVLSMKGTSGDPGAKAPDAVPPKDKPSAGPKPTDPSPAPGQPLFDKLDPNAIPKGERFAWQPKELVAVVGTHAGQSWGGPTRNVAISHDNKWAAVKFGYPGENLHIYDMATGTVKWRLRQPQADYGSLHFLPNGLLVGYFFRNLTVFDLSGPEPVGNTYSIANMPDGKRSYTWSHAAPVEDGRTLVATGGDSAFGLFDLSSGKPRFVEVRGETKGWSGVATDTDVVYYRGADGKRYRARIKGAKVDRVEEHPPSLANLDYCGGTDDARVLMWDAGRFAQLWDWSQNPPKPGPVLKGPEVSIGYGCQTEFARDGRWMLSKGATTALFRFDGAEPKFVRWLDQRGPVSGDGYSSGCAISRDGNRAVVGGPDGIIGFWDLSGREPKELWPLDLNAAFKPGLFDCNLPPARLSRATGEIVLPRFDRDPATQADRWQVWAFDASAPRPGTLLLAPSTYFNKIWPAAGGRWLFSPHHVKEASQFFGQPAGGPFGDEAPRGLVTPDGKLYIALAGDGRMSLEGWDVTAAPVRKWSEPYRGKYPVPRGANAARVVAASADGSRFAVVTHPADGRSTELTLWRLIGGKPQYQATLDVPGCAPTWYTAALSPDGHALAHLHATDTTEPTVVDVSGSEPRLVGKLPPAVGIVRWLAYSPDGRHLAVAGHKGVAVFDAATRQPVWTWDAAQFPVYWLDWSADGRHLVTHNGNNTVYVLRLNQLARAP